MMISSYNFIIIILQKMYCEEFYWALLISKMVIGVNSFGTILHLLRLVHDDI